MATRKNKSKAVGRPTSFRDEYADQAYKLCLLGATDAKLADFFGVSESTLNLWKQAHPKFSESMAQGKDQADAEIAQALFHRAKGYSHPEVDIKVVASNIVQTPLTKHYPPDTQAASLWLRNRQPKLWRDKQDIEHTGADGGAIQIERTVKFVSVPPKPDEQR
jgi:hypothetical protein